MLRQVSLEEISDGRLYGLNDMVKADCQDCTGCSACCRGMGQSIVLDPLDCFRLMQGLGRSMEELLADTVELNVVDGIILPNLKMDGQTGGCFYLGPDGRCTIHDLRPGICRLFPLGRFYEERSFRYFLQTGECRKENRTKVKVKKWIDVPDPNRYEQYICDWHYFLKDCQDALGRNRDPAAAKNISMQILKECYLYPYEHRADFYPQFYQQLESIKNQCNYSECAQADTGTLL